MGRAVTRSKIDGRTLGAGCDDCPANGRNPVPPLLATAGHPRLIVLLEAPAEAEDLKGKPAVGPTGALFDRVAKKVGLKREECHITNAALCRTDGLSDAEARAATERCHSRLLKELEAIPLSVPILAMGTFALRACNGGEKIFEWAGARAQATRLGREMLPSIHPAYALPHRYPLYVEALWRWMRKAVALIDGVYPEWQPPRVVTDRDGDAAIIAALRELHHAPTLGVDVETPMIKSPEEWPEKAKQLLNIGVGSKKLELAVCITWQKASPIVKAAMLELLTMSMPKVMHNGSFDWRVFRYNGIKLAKWTIDTMVAFAVGWPGLQKGLAFVSALLTWAPRWKDAFKRGDNPLEVEKYATERRCQTSSSRADGEGEEAIRDSQTTISAGGGGEEIPSADSEEGGEGISKERGDLFEEADEENRAIYCGLDAYHQDELWYQIKAKLEYVGAMYRFERRMRAVHIACKMTEWGIGVAEPEREHYRHLVSGRVGRAKEAVVSLAKEYGWSKQEVKKTGRGREAILVEKPLNPSSNKQIAEMYLEVLEAPVVARSEITGAPSFDEGALGDYLRSKDKRVVEFTKVLLAYREHEKARNTYIDGLPVHNDGAIHPTWKPMHAITSRWASDGPNAQNVPKWLRRLLKGRRVENWLAGADYVGQEGKIIALYSGDEILLDAFAQGKDVHKINASAIFGVKAQDITSGQREYAKVFFYAVAYLSSPGTVYATFAADPRFQDVTEDKVKHSMDAFFKVHHWIKSWHYDTIDEITRAKRLVEELSGDVLECPGNPDHSQAINWRVQTAGAHMTSQAISYIDGQISDDSGEWTREEAILANQHDDIWLEGPDPYRLVGLLKEGMEHDYTIRGRTLGMTVDPKLGRNTIGHFIEISSDFEPKRKGYTTRDLWLSWGSELA
ncbi:DNA polymerase [Bacteriophage sp.]|nr:DNA polymerase [Bacteriophage sp.]UOF80094.1 DNA polymerase [Bacteriophage sp.]